MLNAVYRSGPTRLGGEDIYDLFLEEGLDHVADLLLDFGRLEEVIVVVVTLRDTCDLGSVDSTRNQTTRLTN